MKLLAVLALVACETAPVTPTPTVPEPPPPPPPADAGPPPSEPDVAVNTQCGWHGGKEQIRIETDPATKQGLLHRQSTGPVPSRYIRFTLRPDGPLAADLIFDRYEKADYKWMFRPMGNMPREQKLVRGKSVIARIFVKDGRSYITGVDVNLHQGMTTQVPDHEYPCNDGPDRHPIVIYMPQP